MTVITLPAPRRSNYWGILFLGILGFLVGWTALGCVQSALDYQRLLALRTAERAALAPYVGTFCDKQNSDWSTGRYPVCGIIAVVCRQYCGKPNAMNEYYLVVAIDSWKPIVLDQHDNKLERGLPENCWFQRPGPDYRCTFIRSADSNWAHLLQTHFAPFLSRLFEPPPRRRFTF